MRIDSSTYHSQVGAPGLYPHALQEGAKGEDQPLSEGGGRRREDRFEPSEAGMALLGAEELLGSEKLLGAEKLLGVAESLPGQGSGEDGVEGEDGTAGPRMEGTEASDLPEVPDRVEVLNGSPASSASAEGAGDEKIRGSEGEGAAPASGELELTEEGREEVKRLQERDREVRAHEQAHVGAGGQYVRGGAQYEYESGPDGRRYAVGGEVQVDTSKVSGDPEATVRKAQAVRRAALAPAEPSTQDYRAASSASQMEAQARQELVKERLHEGEEGGGDGQAGDSDVMADAEDGVDAGGLEVGRKLEVPELEPELKLDGGLSPSGSEGESRISVGAFDPEGGAVEAVEGALNPEAPELFRKVEGPDRVDPGEQNDGMEGVEAEGVDPGGQGDGIEGVEVEGVDAKEISPPSAAGPSMARLDYGSAPQPGQLVDLYR